jgi:hypothetical protein
MCINTFTVPSKKKIAKMYKMQNYYRCFTFLYKFILGFKQTSVNVVFFQKQLHRWASCWYLTCSVPLSTKPVAELMAHHIMLLLQYQYLTLQHIYVCGSLPPTYANRSSHITLVQPIALYIWTDFRYWFKSDKRLSNINIPYKNTTSIQSSYKLQWYKTSRH